MKLKAYFADLTHTGLGISVNYFPLGMGLVVAYASQELKNEVDFKLFKFPDDLSSALTKKVPNILCFSHYAWNSNLSYAFAEYVKNLHPDVVTIFGGPNIPFSEKERESFLKQRPAIDFYIRGDGEFAIVLLLKELIGNNLDIDKVRSNNVVTDNVCYYFNGTYNEGACKRVEDITRLPSPYLTGLMDELFNYPLIPLIETTRGCPYSCTYCNDGPTSRAKVYRKSSDFIREEIEYIASKPNKTSQLMLSDLNFGMFKEDLDTCRIIRSAINKYNWPDRVQLGFGKSHPDRLMEAANIINKGNRGVIKLGASFQSTDPEVLRLIKRKNLNVQDLLKMKNYRQKSGNENVEFFTEIILALPGDTIEKHYKSLRGVIDILEMNNIDVHQLSLLKGSELSLAEMREKFKFTTRHRMFVGCLGIYKMGNDDVPCAETEEIVLASNTISFDEYIECRIMDLLVKIFIDNEPFKETIGLIRKLNLSVFDLLILFKENFLFSYNSLPSLAKSFIEGTTKSLFTSREEAMVFALDAENIKRYISGEFGQNELLTHKAMAYVDYCGDIHGAFKETVLLYLKDKGILDNVVREYIEEAIEFGRLRIFDPRNMREEKEGKFTFDFIKADKFNYEIEPSEIKTNETRYKFYHDDNDLLIIQGWIDSWGANNINQIGKLIQKGNSLITRRKVCKVD